VWPLGRWSWLLGGLFDAEPRGAVGGAGEPGQSRAFQALVWAAMTTVPAAVKAQGLLPTFGDHPGINAQGLGRFSREPWADRRPVEGDHVTRSGLPPCPGRGVRPPVAAQMPNGGVAGEQPQQSPPRRPTRVGRLLGLASHGPDTRPPSHGGPPLAVGSGHTTIQKEDSCGDFSVKTVRSIRHFQYLL
jgi:hypothetical protein